MRGRRKVLGVGLGVLISMTGCTGTTEGEPARSVSTPPGTGDPDRTSRVEQELAAARERIVARADSVGDAFAAVRGLTREERADLRRDVNARQVATARSLGVRATGESQVERLARSGQLVELEDSTRYWVLRELEHSMPYVTPDAKAMLLEVGRRFHARLDSLGLPRYRMEVTSVLRTPETQADLQSSNANAAQGVSAHEFGTTLDVAHVRFAAPASSELTARVPSAPEQESAMRLVEAVLLEEVARQHAAALQAELGRVLREMRDERKLRVMMERRQAVYHMTVARRFPRSSSAN